MAQDQGERKLASIRIIKGITSIPNADRIEIANIDGWSVVVEKGKFFAGEMVVFYEIDSFLPIQPRYEFLRKSSYKMCDGREGFRIKTIKLRGQLSQGLVMPISAFPNLLREIDGYLQVFHELEIGTDLTELLGVTKYEKPIPATMFGTIKGNFPWFVPKTDQERIQNLWDTDLIDSRGDYEVSLKLDGTSMTVYMHDGNFGVCSRNIELKEDPNNLYWKMAIKHSLREMLGMLNHSHAIQGEIVGPGVQDNNEWLDECRFYVFDIFDIEKQCYLGPTSRLFHLNIFNRILKQMGGIKLEGVPILGIRNLSDFNTIGDLLSYADGPSLNPDSMREGLVFRSLTRTYGKADSFKVISNKYLLGKE